MIVRAVWFVVLDTDLAHDVAQEAFCRALERWHQISRYERRGAWVRTVAVHCHANSARHPVGAGKRPPPPASVVLAAASFAAVAGAALGSRGGEHGRVDAGNDASTTEHPATTTSSPPATTNSVPPPPPSMRDVDFGAMTYPAPCPAFDDSPMTLSDGEGENVIDDGASVQAMLGNVAYGDASGDGVEEAVVLVQCWWAGANSDTGLLVAVFGAGADGEAEQIGEALTLEHWQESSLDGLDLHVLLDVYDDDDPMCCPSSQSQEVWRFDGTAFQRVSHQSLPRPPSE